MIPVPILDMNKKADSYTWIRIHSTLPIIEKKYVEILLHYRQLFIKGNVFKGEWGIFGAKVFLHYSQFFVKGNFIIGGVE